MSNTIDIVVKYIHERLPAKAAGELCEDVDLNHRLEAWPDGELWNVYNSMWTLVIDLVAELVRRDNKVLQGSSVRLSHNGGTPVTVPVTGMSDDELSISEMLRDSVYSLNKLRHMLLRSKVT